MIKPICKTTLRLQKANGLFLRLVFLGANVCCKWSAGQGREIVILERLRVLMRAGESDRWTQKQEPPWCMTFRSEFDRRPAGCFIRLTPEAATTMNRGTHQSFGYRPINGLMDDQKLPLLSHRTTLQCYEGNSLLLIPASLYICCTH